MVDAHGLSAPAVSTLRSLRLPPFVSQQTLAAAAKHCAAFGGDREALDAAVLAAGVLQAHMLHAQRANALGLPMPALAPGPGAPSLASLAGGGPVDAEVSEQAKQAMKAAQATNESLRRKERAKDEERSAAAAEAEAAAAAAAAAANPGGFLPGGVDGQVPTLQMPMGAVGQGLPFMQPVLLPPQLMMPTMQPAVASTAPAPTAVPLRPPPGGAGAGAFVPPGAPGRPQHGGGCGGGCGGGGGQGGGQGGGAAAAAASMGAGAKAPPPLAPREPGRVGEADRSRQERREERRDDPSKSSQPPQPPPGDEEPVRCHLHRKPQLGCKICRRVYYSALDPSAQKKDDRARDKLSDRARRGEDDGGLRRGAEAFEVSNKQTFNFNSMLRDQILKNTYFKTLMNIETFEGIVDELYQYAETAEVYGAGTTTVPSTLFCCLFRLFTIGLSYEELQQLLDSRDQPYIRCCGFLYIRFGCAPEKLWDQLGDFCLDDQEFEPSKAQPGFVVTIGEYVEALLMDERYYYTALPRIPVGVKKKIEERLAPLPQYRRRTIANKRSVDLFTEPGTPIEACIGSNDWVPATVAQLMDAVPTRIMVRVRLADGRENITHLGKVILREQRGAGVGGAGVRGRSRSRSPRRLREGSPDWTRHRGKSQAEMLEELRAKNRERAVCSTGKDYARKPIGFMSGLALKRDVGMASTRLREEETYAPRQVEHRKLMTEEDELAERRRSEQDLEKRQLMQQLYEKYGATAQPKPQNQAGMPDEQDQEVLRLG